MFIKCGKPHHCYACIIKKCAVNLCNQIREKRITFVKHLEVRFVIKRTKEKQHVVFWKIYPKVPFMNVEREKSLKWNLTSNSKHSSEWFDRPVKVLKWFITETGSNGLKECLIDDSNASWIAVSKILFKLKAILIFWMQIQIWF